MLTKGLCLLHDNAHPHVARQTVALLDQFGWDIITHPPYSPDLAPYDYHLFPKLKEHLAGRRFSDDDEVKVAVQRFLNDMVASWYDMGIQKLPPAPTKMHRPKWRLCRKIEEYSNFKMIYQLLKINVSFYF